MKAVVSLVIALALAAPAACQGKKERKRAISEAKKVPELVWPLPPEKPRIRWLGSLSNNLDVEPPKKRGWLQKLINEQESVNVLGMERPAGIAVDSRERIYVADTLKGAVFVFDLEKKTLALLGADGQGRLANPFGIAIDSKDNVYVSDTRLKQVNVYDRAWNLTAAIRTVGNETIVNPAGLAVDEARNRLLIVDSRAHKVRVAALDRPSEGTSFGKRGEGHEEFNFPAYVTVDREGRIYVTDTLNFCVKVFDRDFKFLRKIGEHGTGMGMFDRPKGVALDSEGHLYVADASFSNIQIFNSDGQLLLFVGNFGEQPGAFRLPSAVFIDKRDRIYVSDQINKRIQMFQFLRGK